MKEVNTYQESESVLIAKDNILEISHCEIDNLKKLARENGYNKSRLLFHKDKKETLHEMLIVHNSSPPKSFKYNNPHKNVNSAKSWQILEGKVVFVVFNEYGEVIGHNILCSNSDEYSFMLRLNEACYHTLIPITDVLVYIETLLGPFSGRVDAPWAPKEEENIKAQEYIKNICNSLNIIY